MAEGYGMVGSGGGYSGWPEAVMRVVLLLAGLLGMVVLAGCGSEAPGDTATPTATVAPSPTLAPTATSMFNTPTPTVAVAAAPERGATATPGAGATPAPTPAVTAVPLPTAAGGPAGGTVPADGAAVAGGVLRLLGGDPPTLDPHQSGDASSSRYVLEVFGGLFTILPSLEVAPDLAESWDLDPDGAGYTFRLNPAAAFHDGRKVTAEDVRWSLERAADPVTESPTVDTILGDIVGALAKLRGAADVISGVSVVDDATLRVEIDAPKAYFLSKLTYPAAFVVDRANVESGRDWVQAPNGTGPFRLAEYDPGVFMRLERFEGYHLGAAMLEAVEFNLAGGDGLLMYENDEIHFGAVGLGLLESLRDPSNALHDEFRQGPPEFDVSYIGMNSNEPPFDDVNVRLALNYAIDRETIARVLLEGSVVPAKGILPPGFPGYNPGLTGYEYNPERARQLLAESKYGSDTANYPLITMTLPGDFGSSVTPSMEVILATWEAQLGIRMDVLQTEWATYLADLREGRFQIFGGLGWIADYMDPENFLDVLFHSGSYNNHTNYNDPELDALLERARVEADPEARLALYREAERMILAGAAWAPLWHSAGDNYLVKPYVKGLNLSPLIIPRFRFVYFVE